MDTERFVGHEVAVKLTIREIIEKKDGLWYSVGTEDSVFTILVSAEDIL